MTIVKIELTTPSPMSPSTVGGVTDPRWQLRGALLDLADDVVLLLEPRSVSFSSMYSRASSAYCGAFSAKSSIDHRRDDQRPHPDGIASSPR